MSTGVRFPLTHPDGDMPKLLAGINIFLAVYLFSMCTLSLMEISTSRRCKVDGTGPAQKTLLEPPAQTVLAFLTFVMKRRSGLAGGGATLQWC